MATYQTSLFFNHNHHLLIIKEYDSVLDVLAFEGNESLSKSFNYRVEFTSSDPAISKEMMLMKNGSLTLQAPVDQGYGIKVQQPVLLRRLVIMLPLFMVLQMVVSLD